MNESRAAPLCRKLGWKCPAGYHRGVPAAFNIPAYLARIGYTGPAEPNLQTLRRLHRAHMLTVPFENLDIGLRREIVCDEVSLLRKIVDHRRGGFCYEMNGAFAALLRALGFRVTLLSARVPRSDGSEGPEFDHLALRVELEEPWLADVGFGDFVVEPLLLRTDIVQEQGGRKYRLLNVGERVQVQTCGEDGVWKPEYSFQLRPRELEDFAAMCRYHQTSPESPFTQKKLCTIATPEGRITLSNMKLIVTGGSTRQESQLNSEAEWHEALRTYFGVVL
jgi:N-hydroxyarylamine O-acetyltransferase